MTENVKFISDVFDALEKMKEWRPLYEAVLEHTGSRKDAKLAVIYAMRIAEEMEADNAA